MNKEYSKGDEVYVDCDSSFGASSCGIERVAEVRIKYDKDTGAPYQQIRVDDDWYDQRDGSPINIRSAYYIVDR